MHPTGKLVYLHAVYTRTGIFAEYKCNTLRDPIYMHTHPQEQQKRDLKVSQL